MSDDDLDWQGFCKTHFGTTIEKLSYYNAADVDPHTVQVAQLICEQFKFPAQGTQNLAHAFGNLPQAEYSNGEMGIGYGPRNVVHIISNSDSGFVFLGICGTLSEYFDEDVVVKFFLLLAQKSKIPLWMAPLEVQWRRLIRICSGVLATSPFGTVISRYEALVHSGSSSEPLFIVESLQSISNLKGPLSLSTGRDTPWFAAVAEWLFDLPFVIKNQEQMLYGTQARLILLTDNSSEPASTTGGRVIWETIFRASFGNVFQQLDKDALATIIVSASNLTHRTVIHTSKDSRTYFLPQTSEVPGLGGAGLNETVMAWFPEIRRLAHRIEKSSIHGFDEAKANLDEQIQSLEASCMCSTCGNASPTSTEICKASLAEVIVSIGLYIARMVVVPQLYPKRSGIIAFYNKHHAERVNRKGQKLPNAEEEFIKAFSAALPTPLQMLDTALLLFTGSSTKLSPESLCMTHAGLVAAVTNLKPISEDLEANLKASVFISSGVSHHHNRVFQQGIWRDGVSGITYAENFDIVRTKPKEIRQIAKLEGHDLHLSLVWLNKGQEEKAEAAGWAIF